MSNIIVGRSIKGLRDVSEIDTIVQYPVSDRSRHYILVRLEDGKEYLQGLHNDCSVLNPDTGCWEVACY